MSPKHERAAGERRFHRNEAERFVPRRVREDRRLRIQCRDFLRTQMA